MENEFSKFLPYYRPNPGPLIIINNDYKNNLPYIFISELNASFLLDTGSTRSLINPELAYKFYRKFVKSDPFQVQTAQGITYHDQTVSINLPKTFNTNEKHKYYIFKFSPKYDGFIGVNLLKQLKANINMETRTLSIPIVSIKIFYEPNCTQNSTPTKNKSFLQ